MAVYVFRGVDQTTPLDVAVVTATNSNVTANPPAITPASPGAFIVCIGATGHNQAGAQTFTSSDLQGFLTVGSEDTTSSSLGVGHKNDWTSGEFNAAGLTFSGSANALSSWAALSIALRPA
jgi:hypothetical protein